MNKVILLGRLGHDPELRYTQDGQPVCSMALATSENWTDKSGQKQERTEWHKVIIWGKVGENCQKYLTKGRQALVEGKIATRKYETKDGQTKYATEIIASNVQFVGSAPREEQESGPADDSQPPF